MPRLPFDYSKCVMYKIVCNDLNITDCYVGHTTNFINRKSQHKYDCNTENSKNYNYNVYEYIRNNGGWDNWNMLMIEQFIECKSSLEASQRERYWYELLNANLNIQIPSRNKSEYYEDLKDILKKKDKIRNKKPERILYNKEYHKKYYQEKKLAEQEI